LNAEGGLPDAELKNFPFAAANRADLKKINKSVSHSGTLFY
jgi:hypothetical protein